MTISVTPERQLTVERAQDAAAAMLIAHRRAHLHAPVGSGRSHICALAAAHAAASTGKPVIVVTDLVSRALWEREFAHVDDRVDVRVLTPHRIAGRPGDLTADAILVVDLQALGPGVPRAAIRALAVAVSDARWVFTTSALPQLPAPLAALTRDLTIVEFPAAAR